MRSDYRVKGLDGGRKNMANRMCIVVNRVCTMECGIWVRDIVMVCICLAQGVELLGGMTLLEKVCHCGHGL